MDARLSTKSRGNQQRFRLLLPVMENLAEPPKWLPLVIILISILLVSLLYLWPAPLEFPMDDSYIHFVYAENLSEYGGLYFNSPEEEGVGTSSILWVLILAAANWAGVSMHWTAKLMGLAALVTVGISLYTLLRPLLFPWAALASTLLVILSGHMLWFALSGMETMLFLAFGLLALLVYREELWGWLGILLGLLVLTRIEGIVLVLVIGLFDIWRYRAIRRGWLAAGVLCGMICIPWFVYLWLRTGNILPTSGIGRHYSNILAIQAATADNGTLALLNRFPALAYPLVWIGYSIEFILGGYALPAPYLQINPGLGSLSYRLSIWAIVGIAVVVIPLLWLSFRHLLRYLRTPGWQTDSLRAPLILFLAWMVIHNLCYMFYLPIVGTASRYASLNHIALWLALALGIRYVRDTRVRNGLAAGLIIIALANMVFWNRVYDANLEHMLKVRITAADYMKSKIPGDRRCAASDVGALRFYSQRYLVDLGGLIDPNLIDWYNADELDQYLVDHGVTCLALPAMMNEYEGGVHNIAKEMGFTQSSLFDLHQDKVFEINYQRWLLGYLPTMNYQATVTFYSLTDAE